MRNQADDLTMLLSSDWFLEAWGTIGLNSSAAQRKSVQKECRAIVRNILAGVDSYWDADFSPQRREETASRLTDLFESTPDDREVIQYLMHGGHPAANAELDASLITNLTFLLVSEYETNDELRIGVTDQIHQKLVSAVSSEDVEDFIVRLGAEAKSDWDRKLRVATPGNPEHLVDVARETARNIDSFPRLWGRLHDLLSEGELEAFANWLNTWSEKLTGKPALPS